MSQNESEPVNFEWKRRTDGPPWEVIDWQGVTHTFDTEQQGWDFIERDKRMVAAASREARADANAQIMDTFRDRSGVESVSEHEQTAGTAGASTKAGEAIGREGNRRSRRRSGRVANSKKASSRGRGSG